MPKFRIHLANGKSLVLEGDTPPSDQDIEDAAQAAGVRTLLMSAGDDSEPASESRLPSAGAAAGALMTAAPDVLRGVNATARRAMPVVGGLATGAAVIDDVRKGNIKQAAIDAAVGGTATATIAPKVAKGIAMRTGPVGVLSSAAKLARAAGPVAMGAGAAYDLYNAGQEAAKRGEQIGSLPTVETVRQQAHQARQTTEDIARAVIAALMGKQ